MCGCVVVFGRFLHCRSVVKVSKDFASSAGNLRLRMTVAKRIGIMAEFQFGRNEYIIYKVILRQHFSAGHQCPRHPTPRIIGGEGVSILKSLGNFDHVAVVSVFGVVTMLCVRGCGCVVACYVSLSPLL